MEGTAPGTGKIKKAKAERGNSMKMFKKVSSLLLVAAMTASLVGCGAKEDPKPAQTQAPAQTEAAAPADTQAPAPAETEATGLTGKIVVASNRTDLEEKLNAYAAKFMELNPGATVEFETIKEYDDVVATRIAGGEAPDLFYAIDNKMHTDNYQDYFLPIDDLAFTADDILFYENGRASDGNLYVLPLTVSYCGMIYNKQAFAKAGIENIPMTQEEFLADCAKLKDAGITPVGTAFKDVWPIYAWCGWGEVNITAGNMAGENGYLTKDEVFDDVMVNSMGLIRTLNLNGYLEEDIMSAGWDQFKLDLAQANVAMTYSETWLPAQFVELGANQEDIGMFPFPGAKYIKAGSGKMWGVSKDTESPELAKAFLAYMLANPVDEADIPSNKHLEVADPFVAELLSYGVEAASGENSQATFSKIKNDIELDGQKVLVSYVLEEDDAKAQAMLDEWNDKWATARLEYVEE